MRFIQVTAAKEHSLKLKYFGDTAKIFTDSFVIDGIEILIAVPSDLDGFSIPPSKVYGQIAAFPVGETDVKWSTTKAPNQVKIVKFDKTPI